MMLSIAPLLLHTEGIPLTAQATLRKALVSPPHVRPSLLMAAAAILHRELAVDCADALEVVGIDPASLDGSSHACCGDESM
jgi:hypothetical protein